MDLDILPLRVATPEIWAGVALADFDAFLLDHASCERKAAANCMSFIARCSDRPALVEPLVSLAREELEHFGQVYRLIQRRGLCLGPDEKDPYVNLLLGGVRKEPQERLLDRLIAASLIEARSCERFQLVAQRLEDPELRDFYQTLCRSEAGHYRVFVRIAARLFPEAAVAEALERLARREAEAMLATPFRAAVH